MKIAIVGSRGLTVNDLEKYLPEDVTEVVSGGAKGIDTCAAEYAKKAGLKLTEFLPEYTVVNLREKCGAKFLHLLSNSPSRCDDSSLKREPEL
jgi:hypothetical protein